MLGNTCSQIRIEPQVGKRKPSTRAKWRSCNECMQSCAHMVLDTADIVRDGDLSTIIYNSI